MNKISINVTKSPMKILAFVLSIVLFVTSISGVGMALATDSTAKTDGVSTLDLVKVINPDTNEEMFTVKSTFYDYYSDSQVRGANGAKPGKIDDGKYGTKDRATDNSFVKFNTALLNSYDYGKASATNRYPLYCGLFFGDQDSNVNGGFYYKNDSASNIGKNFWLGANSSQKGGGSLGLHASVNAATQGLVDDTLDAEGNITQSNGQEILPYFNKGFLTGTTHENSKLALGSVTENVAFPFRTVDKNGVKTYEFDSKHDTVHLKDNGQLEYLGYNSTYNSKVQVLDQKRDDGDGTKPGFFPFNIASDGDTTHLNYGFGLKLEIPFNMTSDGKINGQDIVFNFSGDDDVWVYIDGQLVLDIGGAHGEVTGKINFSEQYATVSGVKDNSIAFAARNTFYVTDTGIKKDVKREFPATLVQALKDTKKSHTLTMFYMERGKIESNMKVNFNLPKPNSLILTNEITMDRVNGAFKTDTKKQTDKDIFSYDVKDTDDEKSDLPLLKDGESTTYTDQFTTGDNMGIKETGLTNENRVLDQLYDTKWDLNDQSAQISNSENRDSYMVSDDRASKEDQFLFENLGDTGTTNLIANYHNDVLVGDLVVCKDLSDDKEYDDEEFQFKVTFSEVFGGSSDEKAYKGDYYVTYSDGTGKTKNTDNGIITLKAHEAATITGIPVQTKYEVTELQEDENYELVSVGKHGEDYQKQVASGTISKEYGANYFIFVNAKIATPEPTVEPTVEPTEVPKKPAVATEPAITAEPTKEPTPEPTAEPTKEPTPEPTKEVTPEPTLIPTVAPTKAPTMAPTVAPTDVPIIIVGDEGEEPTVAPTVKPTAEPTVAPTVTPSEIPTVAPTMAPTAEPTEVPIEEVDVPNEKVKVTKAPIKPVEPELPAAPPKTGDQTNLFFWLMSVVISAGAVLITGRELFFRKREK